MLWWLRDAKMKISISLPYNDIVTISSDFAVRRLAYMFAPSLGNASAGIVHPPFDHPGAFRAIIRRNAGIGRVGPYFATRRSVRASKTGAADLAMSLAQALPGYPGRDASLGLPGKTTRSRL
jgi:hypothetical protein